MPTAAPDSATHCIWPATAPAAGTAFLVYFAMGLLGASIFGQETEGNIMVNQIVDGK